MTTTTPAPISIPSSPGPSLPSYDKREKIAKEPVANPADTTPSAFAQRAKMVIELEMVALSARLFLLEQLSTMTDEEKMNYLFRLLNKNHDGSLSVVELADGLRKINGDVGFEESLLIAMEKMASFDTTGDAKLQYLEFIDYIQQLSNAFDATFHDLAEMMILSVVFSDTGNNEIENLAAELVESTMTEALLEEKSMFEKHPNKSRSSGRAGDIQDEMRFTMTKTTADKNHRNSIKKNLWSKFGERREQEQQQ